MKNREELITIIFKYLSNLIIINQLHIMLDELIKIKYTDLNFDEYPKYGDISDSYGVVIHLFNEQCKLFYKNVILEYNIKHTLCDYLNTGDKIGIKFDIKNFLEIYTDEELTKFILEYCI